VTLANALIGSPVERVEDQRFLTGRGTYVADMGGEHVLHAVICRSPRPHARLKRVITDRARALPGVVAVLTAGDIGAVPRIPLRQQVLPEGEPYLQPVLAHDRLRYIGEPVAVVVACDAATAEDASELIEIEAEDLPVLADHETAARDDTLLFQRAKTNTAIVFTAEMGDADAAFATAPYTRRERFSVQRHTAHPMETRGLFAEWRDEGTTPGGRLVVHGAAKVPFFNRRLLAQMLGMEETRVDMMEVDVGGGFGARGEFYPEDFLIPFAARHLKRAVRWVEDRREHLMAMNHARETYADLEIACARDGKVLGIRGRIELDNGAYIRTNGFTGPRNVAQFVSGPYYVPNIKIDAAVIVTNKAPAGTYRGPGRYEASFFCERLLDMAARDLGIEAAELRRRNLVSEELMPYKLAKMRHVDPSAETWCDSGAYALTLERCLEEFGWADKAALEGRLIDGRHHGVGVACFIEGGAAGPSEGARMTLQADGTVALHVGSSAIGQGLETVLTQIAGDALGLPMERIRIAHGSTTLVTEGYGSFHSRSTVMGGNAVLITAEALLADIRSAAARRLGVGADAIVIRDGTASARGRSVSFAELAVDGISAERNFKNSKHTYSYGAHAAHVAVDPGTGAVEVLDYVTVEDVGRIINPATLHGQVVGAVVQGLGSVFLEELKYDAGGELTTGSLADYLLPTASDFPHIHGVSLELRPCPNNPLGTKGAGEGGLIATGGVIANAVASALRPLGVEPRHMPLSPQRVWQLIDEARRSGRAT
jgi:carbon-monoxide dehydrogenase large subunit